MEEEDCCSTQLIDGNGEFNVVGLEKFMKTRKFSQCGLSYAIVAIMGPQSSGKSTLLNHLFYTNFKEMDAFRGRSQTTKGIWIAKGVGIEPFTVVMDLEGTDGRERGEDDTTYEKQSALFALAVADVVIINMWCHDIGREQAANKPLLKTVFQVMMRLFSPRKTTLLFVIRDKTKTPLEYLEPVLRADIQKIWDTVSKPLAHKDTPLSDFFKVEVTALSSFEEKEQQFKEQVAQLRQRFFNSIYPGGIAGDRRAVVPASGFSFSSQQMWKVIKENKDLDLPAHKVMVATVRCEEIANEKFSQLASDEDWLALEQAVHAGPVQGFGRKMSSILDACLSEYDMEAAYFEGGVRNAKHLLLKSKALQFVHPTYVTLLGHLRSHALTNFKIQLEQTLSRGEGFVASVDSCMQSSMIEFDKGCSDAVIKQADWDASKIREKLHRDIEAHASSLRTEKLSQLIAKFEKQLNAKISEPVESLFDSGGKDTWALIRRLLKRETDVAISGFSTAAGGLHLDEEEFGKMVQNLKDYSRSVIVKKAREQAGKVVIHMKEKFIMVFHHDNDSMPRVWTGKVDIKAITHEACSVALSILSIMAAIRLDEKPDKIESFLPSMLIDGTVIISSRVRGAGVAGYPLDSSTWEGVLPENTLITPVQCKSIWRTFNTETEYVVTQAIFAQEEYKRSNNWVPPPWAIMAMVVLGFNEFMLLLRNPLYMLALFVVYLFGKAIWEQKDIPGEFRNGTLAGLISLASRFLQTLANLLRQIAAEAQGHPTQGPAIHTQTLAQNFRNQTQAPVTVSSSTLDSSVSSDISIESPQLTRRRVTNAEYEDFS
ncbi:hypothetical protein ACH5RR_018544 [Cinchona calisaya]|uniref:Protein ROOT HAIR DEFECTIVE 3 homolog n=1 Tax=Cinchona calisaya TaxID=153742 RepID=A0ABD2ZQE0_9GENT